MSLRDFIPRDRQFIPVNRDRISRTLSSFQDEMNRLIQDFFGQSNMTPWSPDLLSWRPEMFSKFAPAVDVIENEKDYSVQVEIPGYVPEMLDISIAGHCLTIKGERREEKEDKNASYLRREISSGSFQRTIHLPEFAHLEKAEASFKNGLLTVSVPKKAEVLKNIKKLDIKKAA